jgi:hypothetical protein
MPARRETKRAFVEQQIASLDRIGESDWDRLKSEAAPISESYLRSILRSSGHPLSPLVEGVVTTSMDEAERTLCALAAEYETSDPMRRKTCRAPVLEAKQRLIWALRRSDDGAKRELLLWVSTWLENPGLLADWVSLRRGVIATRTMLP